MLGLPLLHRKIVLYIILTSAYSAALQKHWLPDLEWQTASNWADSHVPQMDNRVIFPQQTRHAVGIAVADDLRLSGIDLPRQGSLVLPRNGKVQVRRIYEPSRRNRITELEHASEDIDIFPRAWPENIARSLTEYHSSRLAGIR